MKRVAQRACVGSKRGVGGGYRAPTLVGPGNTATFLGICAFVQLRTTQAFSFAAELVAGAAATTATHSYFVWHSATANYEWRLLSGAATIISPGVSPIAPMNGRLIVSMATLSGGTLKHYFKDALVGSIACGNLDAMAGTARMFIGIDVAGAGAGLPTSRTSACPVTYLGLSNGTLATDAEALDYLADVTAALQQGRDVPHFRAGVADQDWAFDLRDAVIGGGGLRASFDDRISGVTMTKIDAPNAYSYPMRVP